MTAEPWGLEVARPARRTLDRLPDKITGAIVEFVLGPLITNPHRVGKPLRGPLAGMHSARVGTYRVVYEIEGPRRVVVVYYIDHRADIYRRR